MIEEVDGTLPAQPDWGGGEGLVVHFVRVARHEPPS